jgi:hypothetical protein
MKPGKRPGREWLQALYDLIEEQAIEEGEEPTAIQILAGEIAELVLSHVPPQLRRRAAAESEPRKIQ